MKFGKQFEFYKIPEWSEYYLDYQGIKTYMKFLDKRRLKKKQLKKIKKIKAKLRKLSTQIENSNLSEEMNASNNIDNLNNISTNQIKIDSKEENLLVAENKTFMRANTINIKTEKIMEAEDLSGYSNEEKLAKFSAMYKQKIGAVNNFFMQKLEEYIQNLEKLKNKMKAKNKNLLKEEVNAKRTAKQLNAERDEMGYAVSWKRALSSLYNETSWLHSYHSINNLAIQKIEKKIKKIFKINDIMGIELTLAEIDREFPFFNDALNRLVELRKNIKKLYATEFTNSDLAKASGELETRLQGGGKIKHTKLIFLYYGIIISFFAFFIIVSFIKTANDKSLSVFFPAFNFGLVVIEGMIGCGFVIEILQKYRINYVYILEIDLKARLGPNELFQNGFMMLAIWMIILLLMKLSLNFDLFDGQYALFALILNGLLIVFLFLPFHIMYYSFRKGIVKVLIRNFFPIGRGTVRFKDFLFGDILTSLNKPFASLILSYCLMSCTDCEVKNERPSNCNRKTIACLIVLFYPFFIRFTQCINRVYYTRQLWPHLGNTFKYVGGLSNAIFAWLYDRNKTFVFKIFHIIIGIISQGYMLFWDIYVDWGLGRFGTNNFFLRNKIVYPKKWYYIAIIIDAILRVSWTWNFITIDAKYDEWRNLFMAMLEAYRRIQWCVFRIENENVSNPENYRTILAIPELPLD